MEVKKREREREYANVFVLFTYMCVNACGMNLIRVTIDFYFKSSTLGSILEIQSST